MKELLSKPQRNNYLLTDTQTDIPLKSQGELICPLNISTNSHLTANRQKEPILEQPIVKTSERIAIFIDGANLFYAALNLHVEIDYAKLLNCLTKERQLIRAYFYTGVDITNEKQQNFLCWMRRNNYRVVSKELIQHPDGSKKANLDVEIAVDMFSLGKYCNTIVLLSGDGDLAYAVDKVSFFGVKIEVVSLRSMTSDSLLDVADSYTDLESIKTRIQKLEE